jgi:hypothetical protein
LGIDTYRSTSSSILRNAHCCTLDDFCCIGVGWPSWALRCAVNVYRTFCFGV